MKTHKHHIHYKSQGGSDDPSNLVEIDFIEHARLHALDFIDGGPMFDCRHEGWPYLEIELREAVKQELGKRTSERNNQDNPIHKEGALEKALTSRRSYEGEENPFFGKEHRIETKLKMSVMNTENNNVSLNYRSQDGNHDTDLSVSIDGDNVDEVKLMRLLTDFLRAIGSRVTLNL